MPRVMKIIARALLDPELHLLLFVLGLIALAVFQLGPEPWRIDP